MLLLLAVCGSRASGAGYVFDYDANCNKAYQEYLAMHLVEGRLHLLNEITVNPYNLMGTYIADYEDCIVLLLNCDKEEYKRRQSHMDQRLELLEKGDHNSPWYRFCKAGVYLHWAMINMRMGDMYHQAVYFRKSFMLLKENNKLFPAFEYNSVFGGLQEAVAGSLPSNYKWLAALFGIKGSIKKGTEKLAGFVSTHNAGQPMYAETVLYYLFTRFYLLAEQKEVWDFLNSPRFSTHDNLLNTFVKATLALDYRKADAAIETLQQTSGVADYNRYPVFEYQMGMALLTRCDTGCVHYFGQYLARNKSDLFVKDAWQKMAFAWYVNGNTAKAEYCRREAGNHGSTRIDADKQAEKFVESNVWPNKSLLQARLLIEGGYYARAMALLNGLSVNQLSNPADKAEYYFRLGRVYEETSDYNKAVGQYQNAINTGKERHEQFAARAALQKGRVFEKQGKPQQAIASYRECLDMPEHDFQNSIDNQAKAGLNRLGAK